MGNECPNNDHENESLIKALNSDQHKNQLKTVRSVKEKKEFARFRDMVLHYEYYHKLLKLAFKNNPVLKILYEPESSFNDYYLQMFYILEDITYVNYQECLKLSERSHFFRFDLKKNSSNKSKNNMMNLNKVKFDLTKNNKNQKKKKNTVLLTHSALKSINRPNLKKNTTFEMADQIQNNNQNILSFRYNNNGEKTLYNELVYIMEKICLYDIKKIQKILLIYPINNLRWIIWLALARSKYMRTQKKLNVSNLDIYNDLVAKVELKDDSLMFELHNTLKELKVFKCNWSISLYKIIKCLLLYKQDTKYETGMNILIGVPLLISDCNEEDTFFFARFLFSSYYGLGLTFFFAKDELLLNYLVFIVHYLTKERFPDIYEHLKSLNIVDELWIKKWIKTFFSSIFDLSITIRVWDCVIAVGLKFLVNYSLAIFEYFKDKYMPFKKVKDFLEFFDYDLRTKYKTTKDIIFFRENIIKLAQSYNIPDGKYQLLEKEYLSLLFFEKEKHSVKTEQFDSSKTINNYYSNNESLNEEEYHIKQILRTIIYIPSDYLENNKEEKVINKFQKKKSSKWFDSPKALNRIEETEKDSEISFIDEKSSQKNSKESHNSVDNKSKTSDKLKMFSDKNNSSFNSKLDEEKKSESDSILRFDDDNINDVNNSNPINKLNNRIIQSNNNSLINNNLTDKNGNISVKINNNSLIDINGNSSVKNISLNNNITNLIDINVDSSNKNISSSNKNLIDTKAYDININENENQDKEIKNDLINSSKDDINENKSEINFIRPNPSKIFFTRFDDKKIESNNEYDNIFKKRKNNKEEKEKNKEDIFFNSDIGSDLTFHDEQLPDYINK